MAGLVAEFRYAVRVLRRSRAYTVPALLTLAIGLGATTTIYSIVDAAVLRPLPFAHADRLVTFTLTNPGRNVQRVTGVMPRDFLDWRDRQRVFDAIALEMNRRLILLGSGEPEELDAPRVTSDFFDVLGVTAKLGRTFVRDDEVPGRDRVAVVSHEFWRTRLAGDASAIGRVLVFNNEPYEIVGVLPASFHYRPAALEAHVFVPLAFTPEDRAYGVMQSMGPGAWGRLKAGVDIRDASAEMSRLQEQLDSAHVGFNKGYTTVTLVPALERYVGNARSWMLMLLAAVACVLLIACANVASLALAHGVSRMPELHTRAALGATPARLARQALIESLTVSLCGGAAGAVLAWAAIAGIRNGLPRTVPRAADIGLDWRVFAFALAASALTGLVCALGPGLLNAGRSARSGISAGRTVAGSRTARRLRAGFAWAEVTLALVLTVGAALFAASFARLSSVDPGLDPNGVVTFGLSAPRAVTAAGTGAARYLEDIRTAARAVPGVESAAIANFGGPFGAGFSSYPLSIVERGETVKPNGPQIRFHPVTPELLPLLRIPVVRGRLFTPADDSSATPVAVINQAAVRRYWKNDNPIGQHLRISQNTYEIVGVVADARYTSIVAPAEPEAYLPLQQAKPASVIGGTLLVRLSAISPAAVAAVKAAIWRINKDQPIVDVRTVRDSLSRATAARRFNTLMMGVFGILALVIAGTGVFAVLAFDVTERRREIGIRTALGATPADVVRLFLRQGALILLAGTISGLALAWWLAATVESYLFEIAPRDPAAFAFGAIVLMLAGGLACWLPARRAGRLDPLTTLRSD